MKKLMQVLLFLIPICFFSCSAKQTNNTINGDYYQYIKKYDKNEIDVIILNNDTKKS